MSSGIQQIFRRFALIIQAETDGENAGKNGVQRSLTCTFRGPIIIFSCFFLLITPYFLLPSPLKKACYFRLFLIKRRGKII
ncbi:MAG: hypothetical protein ACTSXH_09520 [Promethearchaeota archaeon]